MLGIAAALAMLVCGLIFHTIYERKLVAKGEHFIAGAKDDVHELTDEELSKLPGFAISLLPLVVVIAIILGERFLNVGLDSVFTVVIALLAGCIIGYILYWNKLDTHLRKDMINTSSASGVTALMNTASVVGFGGTIRAVPAFQSFVSFALSIDLAPLITAAIAVNIIAGITGSSSTGITIFMESLAQGFLDKGVNPQVLHRVSSIAAGVLDSLPHAGPNVTILAVTGLTYRQGYPGVFISTCLVPFCGLIVAIVLASFGLV